MATMAVGPQDRTDIEWLLNEVVGRRDLDEGERMSELFTADARVVTPHLNLNGRSEIHAFFSNREQQAAVRTRHLWSNLTLTLLKEGCVQVDTSALTFGVPAAEADKGVMVMVGNWRYVVIKEPEGWRIAEQKVDYSMHGRLNPIESDS